VNAPKGGRGKGEKAVNTLLGIFKKRIATMFGDFLKGPSGQIRSA
jgi:hypothetical protein